MFGIKDLVHQVSNHPFHLHVFLATLYGMRMMILLVVAVLTSGCTEPGNPVNAVESSSFEGRWYSIRPQGVTTFHSDSHFKANGEVDARFFTCLSTQAESNWTDSGTWTYENNVLTITLVSNAGDESDGESYTNQYTLLDSNFDRRAFRSVTGDYEFWLHRRWSDTPYDCATTKVDIDRDRAKAIAEGRFKSVYPDYTGTDS